MSLVFNMVSASNNMGTSKGAAASNASDVVGTALPFSQTLIQTLTGGLQNASQSSTGAATLLQANSLLSLIAGQQASEQGTGQGTGQSAEAELIAGLTPELDQLDEQVNVDPALLAQLQGWLVQAMAVLNQNGNETDAAAQTSTELPQVAQNPGTIRFAVQDALNQLVSLMDGTEAGEAQTLKPQAFNVLNQFADILKEAATGRVPEAATSSAQALVQTQTTLGQEVAGQTRRSAAESEKSLKMGLTGSDTAKDKTDGAVQNAMNASVKVADENAGKTAKTLETPIAAVTTETEENAPKRGAVAEGEDKVVTAGQLSLRDGLNGPMKSESTPVPAHRFAQEMHTFIGNRLEVIKRGDALEATLSLFPEHLGQVDVKISMQNGQLVAQFVTEHAGAKDLLEHQMSQLKAALQSQGLQVEKLEVTQNTSTMQSQMYQDGRRSGTGGQQNEDRRSKSRGETEEDKVAAAELEDDWRELMNAVRNPFGGLQGNFTAEA